MWKLLIRFTCILMLASASYFANAQPAQKGEIIYHLFVRSFFDSNGDGIGDLNGVRQKLDYLQELGVTSILFLPLYESEYYHNYFAVDFSKIDPEFGTMQDYIRLVKEIHRRGMKIYMDMEMQYVTEDQSWWKDSYGHPGSKYGDYILYNDSAHTKPESIIYGLTELPAYNGVRKKVATANLYSPGLQEYTFQVFKYFVDPNDDGKFDDGVDGFRLDHMMDDLDFKGRLTHLFERFWTPLFARLKKINPTLRNVAEQAVWMSYGEDYFQKGNVDRVFAFQLRSAIASFDKEKIAAIADTTLNMTPPGKQQVVFIENHDMERFASVADNNLQKEKIGGALNLLIGGVPAIYYGQELGMFGKQANGKYGLTDANDIPVREAFEWYKTDAGSGMALWYRNGPWWDDTNLKPNDGISLEEEEKDSNSIFNFYKNMIRLRQSHAALISGKYRTLFNNNSQVLSFSRIAATSICVVINLSNKSQEADIDVPGMRDKKPARLWGTDEVKFLPQRISVQLQPYAIDLWQLQ